MRYYVVTKCASFLSLSLSLKRLLSLSLSFDRKLFPLTRSLSLFLFPERGQNTRASFFFFRVCVCVRLTHAQLDVFPELPRATSLSLSRTNARNQRAARKKFLFCEAMPEEERDETFFQKECASTQNRVVRFYAFMLPRAGITELKRSKYTKIYKYDSGSVSSSRAPPHASHPGRRDVQVFRASVIIVVDVRRNTS